MILKKNKKKWIKIYIYQNNNQIYINNDNYNNNIYI